MAVEKTFNGTTYNSVTSFAEVSYVSALLTMAGDIMEDAGRGLVTASATSATIGTGSKGPFTMASAIPYALGSFVTIADSAAPTTNYMVGQVTARSGAALTVNVAAGDAVGSGTKTAWSISISGPTGATGATGAATLAGNATGAIDMVGYTFTADSMTAVALTVTTLTLAGAVAGADQEVARVKLKDYAETLVTANTGTAYTVDLENSNVLDLTLTGNCTFTFSNPPASGTAGAFTMILTQDGTGSRTVTWPASVEWAASTAPTITATAGGTDVFTFITVDGGTTWRGFTGGQAFG